jgi:hypothetical protein
MHQSLYQQSYTGTTISTLLTGDRIVLPESVLNDIQTLSNIPNPMTFILKVGLRKCSSVVREFSAEETLQISSSVAQMLQLDEYSIGNARINVCSFLLLV